MEILSNRAVRGNQITGGTYHNSKDGGGGENLIQNNWKVRWRGMTAIRDKTKSGQEFFFS